jgi:hypothetical protein
MGQFKPMVKMMTDEPSVILKLKKGGKVSKMAMGGDFAPMQSTMPAQAPAMASAPMGMAPKKPSMMARRRAMNPNMMKSGGKAEKHEDAAQDRAMIKKALAGKKFASGGAIDKDETKTTIEGNAGKFVKTKMHDGDKTDKAHGTKGIKEKNAGGYKMGGTIEGNAGKFAKTKVVDGDKTDKAHGTKGIKESNAGGYAKGGKVNWENRPADTAKPGKDNGTTGGVRESNAGGYKKGGSAKKAYATGGTVDTGKAVKMPKHFVSRPVANSLQSGTFAKGGEVKKKDEKPNLRLVKTHTGPKGHVAKVYKDRNWEEYRTKFYSPEGKHLTEGDSHTDDLEDAHMTAKHEVNRGYAKGGKAKKYAEGSSVTPAGDPKVVTDKASRELEDALNPLSMIKEGYGKIKDYFTSKPAGSVTKTEKSVTVAPRKRGGRA